MLLLVLLIAIYNLPLPRVEYFEIFEKVVFTLTSKILKIPTYRGVGLIRTMEIAKKSHELAPPCKSKFSTKKLIFDSDIQTFS